MYVTCCDSLHWAAATLTANLELDESDLRFMSAINESSGVVYAASASPVETRILTSLYLLHYDVPIHTAEHPDLFGIFSLFWFGDINLVQGFDLRRLTRCYNLSINQFFPRQSLVES